MATPPISPLPPPTDSTSHSPSTLKWTRKETRLRLLASRPIEEERPLVHVDLVNRKVDSPLKKKQVLAIRWM